MVKTKFLAKRKHGLKKLLLGLNGLQCLELILLPGVHEFLRLQISGFASGYIMRSGSGICSIKNGRTCHYLQLFPATKFGLIDVVYITLGHMK